jgi:hypothetical protein
MKYVFKLMINIFFGSENSKWEMKKSIDENIFSYIIKWNILIMNK